MLEEYITRLCKCLHNNKSRISGDFVFCVIYMLVCPLLSCKCPCVSHKSCICFSVYSQIFNGNAWFNMFVVILAMFCLGPLLSKCCDTFTHKVF